MEPFNIETLSITSHRALANQEHAPEHLAHRSAAILQGIRDWLSLFSGHTLRGHTKEVSRLLFWLNHGGLSLGEVNAGLASAFYAFLAVPPVEMIGPATRRYLPDGTLNPTWRPFTGPLSPASIRQTASSLSAMCRFLIEEGVMTTNPFRAGRKKNAAVKKMASIERWIEERDWLVITDYLDHMEDVKNARQRARARWVMMFIYYTGARRFEAAKTRLCDFTEDHGRLWWKTVGKGNKEGKVPMVPALVDEWNNYRAVFNLPALPSSSTLPAITTLDGENPIQDRMVYLIVKQVLRRAAAQADPAAAARITAASTHWLRHSAASHQLHAGVPLKTVQQNLRHSDISTTSGYLHAAEDLRHEETSAWGASKSD